jgi:xanthine/CO dehydrogenase XdhC/CoxF family maturation factor
MGSGYDAMLGRAKAMEEYKCPPLLATVEDVMARLEARFKDPKVGMVIVFWGDGRVTTVIDGKEQPDHVAADAARMIGPRERGFIKRLCVEVPRNLLRWPIAVVHCRTGFMLISMVER